MYSRKTLRKLPAMTRRIAREINSIELATRHLKKELELISSNESEVIAWINRQQYFANQDTPDPLGDWPQDSTLSKISKSKKE